jgi:SPW repeat
MTTERTTDQLPISKHPDIVALHERYERAFETPQAWTSEGLLMMAATYAAISPWVVGFHTRSGGAPAATCRRGRGIGGPQPWEVLRGGPDKRAAAPT